MSTEITPVDEYQKPQYPFDLPDERESSGVLRKSKSIFSFVSANDAEEDLKIAPYAAFKAISLPKFIEKLVYFPSAAMYQYFTRTYRAYGSPLVCARLLLERFNGPTNDFLYSTTQKEFFEAKQDLIRNRVRKLAEEFVGSLELNDYKSDDIEKIREIMTLIFEVSTEVLAQMDEMIGFTRASRPRSRTLKRDDAVVLKSEFTSLSQLDVDDVAFAITMKDMSLFKKVMPSELVTLAWSGKDAKESARNVSAFTDYFNWVSTWIVAKLLAGKTASERASTIDFFVKVGMKFKSIYNYNGVMQIVCSLNCAAVSRLKQTWELVTEQSRRSLSVLEILMCTARNSNEYRQELAKVPAGVPSLPFFGLFLTDIMFTATGNAAVTEDNLVNMNFVLYLGKVMSSLAKYQALDYQLGTQSNLKLEQIYEEAELYALSLLREPMAPSAPVGTPFSSPVVKRRLTSGSIRSSAPRSGSRQVTFIPNDDFVPRVTSPSEEDLKYLTSSSTQHVYNAGETFIREGQDDRNLYFIVDGEVSHYKKPYKNPIVTLGKNEVFNVISFISDNGCWATVTANVDTTVLIVSEKDANDLLRMDSAVGARFQRMFARRVSGAIRAYMAVKSDPEAMRVEEDEDEDEAEGDTEADPYDKGSSGSSGSSPPVGLFLERRGSGQFSRRSVLAMKNFTCRSGMYTGNLCITMQHTLFHSRGVFGFVKKHTINNQRVSLVTLGNQSVSIHMGDTEKCKFIFKNESDALEAKTAFDKVCRPQLIESNAVDPKPANVDSSVMQDHEWKLLLKGAQCVTFRKGTVLVQEGSKCKNLIQIVGGRCNIQKNIDMVMTTVATRENSVIGEMSFLDENQVASASVVADTDVEAFVLGASYINILLNFHSEMAPKFYKHLSSLMIKRLIELDDPLISS